MAAISAPPSGAVAACCRSDAIAAFGALARADSVTLDPHKLGFVPMPVVRSWCATHRLTPYPRSAPYLIEDKKNDHPGWSTTLEGSAPPPVPGPYG